MALQLLLRAGNLRGQGWHAGRLYELNGRGTSLTASALVVVLPLYLPANIPKMRYLLVVMKTAVAITH
jgi:hypothetical protein